MNTNQEQKQDYWSYVKRQFKKNKRALFSFYVVLFMLVIAIFADFLANEKPIVCTYQGKTYFPILKEYAVKLKLGKFPPELNNIIWSETKFDFAIRPPIPYSPTTQDILNSGFVSPYGKQDVPSIRWRHWLGTEGIGRDILSALIHGTRIAFIIGLISMSIASVIGILLGSLAGFFGDKGIQISRAALLMGILCTMLGLFYANAVGGLFTGIAVFFACILIGYLVSRVLKKIPFLAPKTSLPIDIIVQRMIEVLVSIPRLFLIIAVVAISKPSIFLVMVVIGLTSWTEIARFIRAELLKIRSLEYIEASEALGYPKWRILLKHAIPNALSPVLITIAFGIAAAILTESFLSFIGLGIPPETLTWGKLLSLAQGGRSQLWVAIFPGFAIFVTVTLFNLIGEGLTDALDPRQKK
ncbi:MAG TPA: ABC transporter permease [Chitinophagales bacterium]|nr:ABC transporter permease [Chitinophagales bacterium]HNF50799.1 ABC transporter permease [Chitinophagales bacterium]HNK74115.1 ABC transporter permease [Chitinophagales bacterium]